MSTWLLPSGREEPSTLAEAAVRPWKTQQHLHYFSCPQGGNQGSRGQDLPRVIEDECAHTRALGQASDSNTSKFLEAEAEQAGSSD